MIKLFFSILLLWNFLLSFSQKTDSLREKINKIILDKHAIIGVVIYGIESKDTLSVNGKEHFPMQSVYKFHIVLTVLNLIDKGKLSLDQKIHITKNDLYPNTWSPLYEKYPNGNIELTLREILRYTVSQSDNNGCDMLLRLIGGTKIVDDYIHSIGITDVSINATEEEMRKGWNVQYSNWTTPLSAMRLLMQFYNREILSEQCYDFLWKTMLETSTCPNRIKGELPFGTPVAHKTGTSDRNDGVRAAVNDIGIVLLPNGKHFAICVFVSNSTESDPINDKIIAEITKAAWDYFTTHQ